MKRISVLFLFLMCITDGYCCVSCNREIQEAIYDSTFYPNLFTMLLAFFILGGIVLILINIANRRHRIVKQSDANALSPVPLLSASIVLGIGLGGFMDGIVLHQILQWHQMLSNKVSPSTLIAKSVNMFWDGIFHFFCLMVVFIGIALLWKVVHRKDIDHSGKILIGGMLAGWGIFNLVEGIIDHHILKLHNVKELSADYETWNLVFLAASVLLIVVGGVLIKKRKSTSYNTHK